MTAGNAAVWRCDNRRGAVVRSYDTCYIFNMFEVYFFASCVELLPGYIMIEITFNCEMEDSVEALIFTIFFWCCQKL